ncbi:MAG: TRAP transporter substrate-binding protein [Proteobacteria bacterium]|nr:TRAP transporter substrate-binding protein [Pseudomonadota bacterium]
MMNHFSEKMIRMATVAAAFVAMSHVAPAMAQDVRWDMPNEYGEATVTGKADKVFSELLAANSNGRIQITHHFGGSLGFRSVEHWSAVEDAAVPLASTYVGVFTGLDPIFLLTSMPFLATNPTEARTLIDAARDEYDAAFAKSGQILLFTEPWVPVGIWATRPVISTQDIQGLRIRTYDKNGTEVMQAIGAAPVQMTWSDVVPALATNTIESVLTGASPGLSTNFQDYLKHYHEVGFVMGSSMVHMNRDVFESLPADLQQIVLDTAAQAEDIVWQNVVEALKNDVANLDAAGVTFHPEVSAELVATLQGASVPILEAWKGVMPAGVADGILARYEALMAERN